MDASTVLPKCTLEGASVHCPLCDVTAFSGVVYRLGCPEAEHTIASAVYSCANLSGGHITPSVTIATMVTGHIGILKGLLYMLSQVGFTVWP